MKMQANNKSFKYFYKQMSKTHLSAFIIFILLMIYLPAYSATLVEEEEVKNPEIVQETTVSNEQTEVQAEVKSEGQSAEIEEKTPNNKIHETDSKPSERFGGADAAILVGLLFALIVLIFGGVALQSHSEEKYDYNVFSAGNIFLACIASILLIAAFMNYNEQGMTSAALVFMGAALICYVLIFVLIASKTNGGLAIISVLYLFIVSVLIIAVVAFFILRAYGKKNK